MEILRRFFPLSFKANTFKDFLITVVIYIVLDFICGCAIGLLGKLPLIGMIFGLVGWVLGIYFALGLLLSILVFLNIVKS